MYGVDVECVFCQLRIDRLAAFVHFFRRKFPDLIFRYKTASVKIIGVQPFQPDILEPRGAIAQDSCGTVAGKVFPAVLYNLILFHGNGFGFPQS